MYMLPKNHQHKTINQGHKQESNLKLWLEKNNIYNKISVVDIRSVVLKSSLSSGYYHSLLKKKSGYYYSIYLKKKLGVPHSN